MATTPKESARSRRAYIKRTHLAEAEYAGATVLDVTVVARARDGHYVIKLYDGTALHLDPWDEEPDSVVTAAAAPTSRKRVYAPKNIPADRWNDAVSRWKEAGATKAQVRAVLKDSDLNAKQKARAIAVIDALPDAPDWYAELPLAEDTVENDSQVAPEA